MKLRCIHPYKADSSLIKGNIYHVDESVERKGDYVYITELKEMALIKRFEIIDKEKLEKEKKARMSLLKEIRKSKTK